MNLVSEWERNPVRRARLRCDIAIEKLQERADRATGLAESLREQAKGFSDVSQSVFDIETRGYYRGQADAAINLAEQIETQLIHGR